MTTTITATPPLEEPKLEELREITPYLHVRTKPRGYYTSIIEEFEEKFKYVMTVDFEDQRKAAQATNALNSAARVRGLNEYIKIRRRGSKVFLYNLNAEVSPIQMSPEE